jgi:hypothetical protein
LPVTSDAIPALAQITSQATVSVLITATDAAGNVGQITPARQFQFQLVTPPVAFLEDASYASGWDSRSVFAFRLANNTYTGMFSNPIYPTDTARFVRYVAYNPAGKSLALSSQLGGVPGDAAHPTAVVERWEAWSDYAPNQPAPGNCYQAYGMCISGSYLTSPCGGSNPAAYLSNGGVTCNSWPTGIKPETKQDTWQLNALPYQVSSASEQLPAYASNGGVVVPAASGSTAGRVAFYLSVPSRAVPGILTWDSTLTRYQYGYASYDSGAAPATGCNCDPSGPSNWCPAGYACYASSLPWFLYLSQADSLLYGSLTFNTSNLVPAATTTTVLGPPSSNSAIIFSRTLGH